MMETVEEKIAEILKMGEDANGLTFMLVASILKADITHYTTYDNLLGTDTFSPMEGIKSNNISLNLLLKPGHYDIINKKDEILADGYDFETPTFGNI